MKRLTDLSFLSAVRRGQGFTELADALEQSTVRPAMPSFYRVRTTAFQS
ncbi:hypothetical protein PV342_39725 [Streptomyces sp. PA03-3a]|nr:hypothetical protein [Streptomyces sp. PA03-3a]